MTDPLLTDRDLDRLLSCAPHIQLPHADLAERIAAHAATTPQGPIRSQSWPRRSLRRQPRLWLGIMAINLVAAAAAATSWNGHYFSLPKLAAIAHHVEAALNPTPKTIHGMKARQLGELPQLANRTNPVVKREQNSSLEAPGPVSIPKPPAPSRVSSTQRGPAQAFVRPKVVRMARIRHIAGQLRKKPLIDPIPRKMRQRPPESRRFGRSIAEVAGKVRTAAQTGPPTGSVLDRGVRRAANVERPATVEAAEPHLNQSREIRRTLQETILAGSGPAKLRRGEFTRPAQRAQGRLGRLRGRRFGRRY